MRVKRYALGSTILSVLVCIGLSFLGCGTSPAPKATPAPIAQFSGDAAFAKLLETIRIEEGLPALTAAIIVDGKIYSVAFAELPSGHCVAEDFRYAPIIRMGTRYCSPQTGTIA